MGISPQRAHHQPDQPAEKRYVVALRKDGTYRMHDVTDPHWTTVFSAALVIYKETRK